MNSSAGAPGKADAGGSGPDFSPEPIRFDRVRLSAFQKIRQMGAAHGLPFLWRFLQQIQRVQNHAHERFGRRYQQGILVRRGLRLYSPRTGNPVTATESIAVHGKTFYRFVETDPAGAPIEYFVFASRIRWGFPLVGLFVPQQNWLLAWEHGGNHSVTDIHLAELKKAESARYPSTPVSRAPVIIMGHTSFAHHLWNELSALETILRSDRLPAKTPILVAREPLGNIEDIFPELRGHSISRVDPSVPLCGIQSGGLFVNLGALCIPERLRRRIVGFAQNRASEAARAIIADLTRTGGPVFWISVRTQIPTLTNQHDVLLRIIGLLFHTYKRCAVVLDGFSLPEDYLRMPEEMQAAYARFASETRKASEDIIASVQALSPSRPHQLVTTIAGMSLLDCIAIAQCATAYLCHAGSIQHKIGWTANVPGIIHGNRQLSPDEFIARHSARLENGVAPLVTPRELLADVAADEHEHNYTCVDPVGFSRLVLEHFRRCLSLAPCGA